VAVTGTQSFTTDGIGASTVEKDVAWRSLSLFLPTLIRPNGMHDGLRCLLPSATGRSPGSRHAHPMPATGGILQ